MGVLSVRIGPGAGKQKEGEMDLELFYCAKINFDNTEKMMPILKKHPIFQLAKEQLSEAIKKAEKNDEEK
jgi:hypothetical protein